MAYTRFGESDLYVFRMKDNTFVCCCCSLGPDFFTKSGKVMASHLREHQHAGDGCDYDEVIAEILADSCEESRGTGDLLQSGVL
jgi:hypothetical protein